MSPRVRVLAIASLALLLASALALPEPSVYAGADWLRLHLLYKAYAKDALSAGHLPLWNPWVALGRPFLADTETAVLYPPNLLYLVLPIWAALFVLIVGHLALAVTGMLELERLLGFPPWLAWLQATVFGLGAPLVLCVSTGQIPYSQAMCYVPIALAAAMRLQDAPSGRRLATLACVLALQLLCGHPQMAWLTWLGMATFVVGRSTVADGSREKSVVVGWAWIAAALALALAASAAMLLPFAELAYQGNRSAPTLEFASGGTMEWRYWLSLFAPDAGRRVFLPARDQYDGLLAVLGIVGLLRVRDRNARGLLAMGAVGFFLAAGLRTPVFRLLFHIVPGVAQLHLHSRAARLLSFALLLGTGLFLRQPVRGGPRLAALAGAAVLTWGSAFLALRLAPAPRPLLAEPTLRLALFALAGVLVLPATLAGSPARAVAARVALGAIVLGELALALQPSRAEWFLPSPSAGERPLFSALQQAGLYPPSGVPPRVLVPPWVVRDDAGLLYKWSRGSGYNALTLDRVWIYEHARLGITPPTHENTYPSEQIWERGPFPYHLMNLAVGWDSADSRLMLRSDRDPRAYLVAAARPVESWREAVRLLAAGHDPRQEALVEAPVPGLPAATETASEQDVGTAEIRSFAPARVVVTAEAEGPRLLVLAEAYYPGWDASLDGQPAPCVPANAWMRAVALPAGRHEVTFTYRSRWLLLGTLISVLASGAIILLWRRS
jgi:hypothetical protein